MQSYANLPNSPHPGFMPPSLLQMVANTLEPHGLFYTRRLMRGVLFTRPDGIAMAVDHQICDALYGFVRRQLRLPKRQLQMPIRKAPFHRLPSSVVSGSAASFLGRFLAFSVR
jgi:hypothetical protein